MSDDLEHFLRSEFAARVQDATPPVDGLADAAIGGARRIRRRRRVAAGAGGVAAVVFAAGAVAWAPLTALVDPDGPPVASDVTAEEAQQEFDVEFVAERQGEYGVINTDDEFIPLSVSDEPTAVDRLAETYVASSPETVQVVSLDGGSSIEYGLSSTSEFATAEVRSDAEAFAVSYTDDAYEPDRWLYDIYPGGIPEEPEGPSTLALDYSLNLLDWNDSLVVLSADLISTSGGASGGPYYFNEQGNLGLESIASAGYQAAVLADYSQDGYVCVSDLEPGTSEAGSEQCGQIGDPEIDTLLTEAAGGDAASADFVDEAISRYWSVDEMIGLPDDSGLWDSVYDREFNYTDPGSQWHIAFDPGDDVWTLVDSSGDEPVIRELTPPEGALFPVRSYI
ncbi:hypothetical protein [Glycomyces salinus]|uniref:hypothetical protein n=1 Tax=Glycomyces salinus TaxID=980294 RepID=UPI0018EB506D|nr:hypothetical protein [Glycomyces salinus]